jgi:metallo-beta-lactamase family protein
VKLTFLGAAGTVTGSRFLLASDSTRVLVDCGLFHGLKIHRRRNWEPLPFHPRSLDAIVLTHAHLDHSGYLPVLVNEGFAKPIYCTPPTRDLCRILLPDAGRIQEEDARYANRKGFSRHRPALPLYTEKAALRAARKLCAFGSASELAIGDMRFSWRPSGHILGAASLHVHNGAGSILFSGDLGRFDKTLMLPPSEPGSPDWVVMESTYGDTLHPEGDPLLALRDVVRETAERGGILLVPAFAVGRAQLLLHSLEQLFAQGLAERMPVYVDSPMATDVTDLYARYVGYHRLSLEEARSLSGMATFARTVEESKALARVRGPAVIISASGMLSGGRVLHHLRNLAPSPENTILLVGFQAPGTRGAALLEGERELKVHGRYVTVRAEVVKLDVFSAHADQGDLLAWIGACEKPPRGVFLVHGEPPAADAFRKRCEGGLGLDVHVPQLGETATLDSVREPQLEKS